MITILFVDEISLHFTRPQSNCLKSNNRQAIAVVHDPQSGPMRLLGPFWSFSVNVISNDSVVLAYDPVVLRKDTGVIRGLPIDCDQ